MAAKPTDLPRWATDGGATLEPASGEKDTGYQVSDRPPARKLNWLLNRTYQWLTWINDRFFDGATSADLVVQGVDAGAGTDLDGGDVTVSGGQATGDGGSEILLKVVEESQGAGVTTRNPTQVGKVSKTSKKLEMTEGIKSTGGTNKHGVEGIGGSASGYGVRAEATKTSPVSAATHIEPQDDDPSSPEAGNLYMRDDGADAGAKPRVYNGSDWDRAVMQSLAEAPTSDSLASFTGWTAFTTKYTIPAFTMRVGSTVRVRATCDQALVSGTMQFKIQIGGTDLVLTVTSAVSGDDAVLEGSIVVAAIGLSGNWRGGGIACYGPAGGTGVASPRLAADASFNTNGANDVEVFANASISNAGNTATLTSLIVDVL
jgi:hypothetical protein